MIDPAWVALSLTERVGGKTLRALMAHFNHDPRAILTADELALRQVPGIGAKMAERIRSINVADVERAIPRWQAAGVRIILRDDPDYPPQLRALDDFPPTLFIRGLWQAVGKKRVAVVGTRSPSPEARQIAVRLGIELSERGCTVVSGLALGIDAAAHNGALTVPDAYLLAVLGCGVLNIYPPEHRGLAEAVMRRGALLGEVHPYASTNASNLVARNRIITGLSEAVIVVETEVDGGAMHAARFAAAQGRAVYTFDSPATGNRHLLDNGAVRLRPDLGDLPF
ncbi:MAG: DNA-protecting protein DprA [Anaerolineae bacterium]|nr:DNA-protecting protein DprA [Anaerolineae bacterium]